MHRLVAIIKQLLSYTKTDWDFDDYPIRTWKNPNAREAKVEYGAGIINWTTMVGHGTTPRQAVDDLRNRFGLYKDHNRRLPRPGTRVPLKFASTEQIRRYADTAVDFFQRVLDMDYFGGFYSDGTCLAYFEPPHDDEEAKRVKAAIIRRTLLVYNVDITDLYDGSLWKILKTINEVSSGDQQSRDH
jgi:hypothetical protein